MTRLTSFERRGSTRTNHLRRNHIRRSSSGASTRPLDSDAINFHRLLAVISLARRLSTTTDAAVWVGAPAAAAASPLPHRDRDRRRLLASDPYTVAITDRQITLWRLAVALEGWRSGHQMWQEAWCALPVTVVRIPIRNFADTLLQRLVCCIFFGHFFETRCTYTLINQMHSYKVVRWSLNSDTVTVMIIPTVVRIMIVAIRTTSVANNRAVTW